MTKTFIIIPCYNPNYSFTRFFNALSKYLTASVECIIVSDGNSEERLMLIEHTIQDAPHTHLLAYPNNQGKGFAIKYAISYLLDKYPDIVFNIITADADGQHAIDDIFNFVKLMEIDPDCHLLLGIRRYGSWIPFHSKLGHFLSNILYRILFKLELEDTHCGLRGFNSIVAQDLLNLPWNRFDFEAAMIPYCANKYYLVTEYVKGIYNKEEYKTTYRLRDWWYNLKSMLKIYRFLRRSK